MKRSATAAVVTTAALLGSVFGIAEPAAAAARHSPIFAGYEVSKPKAHIKHVTATFVVPRITCEHEFGGVGPSVLVYSKVNPTTGTHRTSGGGIGVACQNGNAFYKSVFIVNDRTVQSDLLTLSPGDVVGVSVSVTPAGTEVSINDTTTDESRSHSGAGKIASQTFIGDNSVNVNGEPAQLNPFTKTHVTNVRIDDKPLGSTRSHRYVWERNGTTLVTASRLTDGESFNLRFRSSG